MLLKSIQGRAFPAAVPEPAGPQHAVTLKVTPCTHQREKMEAAAPKTLPKLLHVPQRSSSWATKKESWFPRILVSSTPPGTGARNADVRPAGATSLPKEAAQTPWGWVPASHAMPACPEWLPGRAVGDTPGEGTSQQLRRTHGWPGLPGHRKIGHPRQLAAPVSDRGAGGELHARLSFASPAHGRLAATAENRPPALPSCHPPRALLSPLPERQESNGEMSHNPSLGLLRFPTHRPCGPNPDHAFLPRPGHEESEQWRLQLSIQSVFSPPHL